jgi:hypothetical protein
MGLGSKDLDLEERVVEALVSMQAALGRAI